MCSRRVCVCVCLSVCVYVCVCHTGDSLDREGIGGQGSLRKSLQQQSVFWGKAYDPAYQQQRYPRRVASDASRRTSGRRGTLTRAAAAALHTAGSAPLTGVDSGDVSGGGGSGISFAWLAATQSNGPPPSPLRPQQSSRLGNGVGVAAAAAAAASPTPRHPLRAPRFVAAVRRAAASFVAYVRGDVSDDDGAGAEGAADDVGGGDPESGGAGRRYGGLGDAHSVDWPYHDYGTGPRPAATCYSDNIVRLKGPCVVGASVLFADEIPTCQQRLLT